jgi:hypothetical protein
MPIGEDGLGEYARGQLDAVRRDPRLKRGPGAMIDDFGLAVEEAERTRAMSQIGLQEIRHAYVREKAVFDRSSGGGKGRDQDVQVFWVRSEMARAEIENDYPAINAQALSTLNSSLDALVEHLAPAVRDLPFEIQMKKAEEEVPQVAEHLTPELRQLAISKMQELLKIEELKSLKGKGAIRYERRLKAAGLDAPKDRPIPKDLDQALIEFGVIRDCLIHRAGRIDRRALELAHSLTVRYEDGDLIRLTCEDYRTYSAAIRCYGAEVIDRLYGKWPGLSDPEDKPDLDNWRGCHLVGA